MSTIHVAAFIYDKINRAAKIRQQEINTENWSSMSTSVFRKMPSPGVMAVRNRMEINIMTMADASGAPNFVIRHMCFDEAAGLVGNFCDWTTLGCFIVCIGELARPKYLSSSELSLSISNLRDQKPLVA
jgi:hypothetical protein